ncbi:hypothetical protein OG225_10595 [Nocardia sp. NBC_01377]|uniref:hypothetical protein n=1 Tax=Nocardia sp. NBC_01377 TaxID=2903595 RepID=UPI003249E520
MPTLRVLTARTLSLLAGVVIGSAASGCSSPPESDLPVWPSGVEQPSEYPFGDVVMVRDQRAWGPVFDSMASGLGNERITVVHLTVSAEISVEVLQREFDEQMIEGRGWRLAPYPDPAGEAWVRGYRSSDGRHMLALVGLEPQVGTGVAPLTAIGTFSRNS